MKKIIITGATGFIGRNMAEEFYSKGYEIVATGRSEQIGRKLEQIGISFVPADITEKEEISKVFCSADYVIHCAGKAGDWGSYKDFYEINVKGTKNIINACDAHGINQLIFMSSPSVYYNGQNRIDIRESDPLPEKQFYYGKTKLMAEKIILDHSKNGFKSVILRPRAVYGRYDTTLTPRILAMSEKKNLPLINNGMAKVDITCIENLLDAVEKCLKAPDEAWNQVYNITNGEPIPVNQWFSTILDLFNRPFRPKNIPEFLAKNIAMISEAACLLPFTGKEPKLTRFSVGYMAKTMTMSLEKASRKIGYVPKINNQEGFENYRNWVQKSNPQGQFRCGSKSRHRRGA